MTYRQRIDQAIARAGVQRIDKGDWEVNPDDQNEIKVALQKAEAELRRAESEMESAAKEVKNAERRFDIALQEVRELRSMVKELQGMRRSEDEYGGEVERGMALDANDDPIAVGMTVKATTAVAKYGVSGVWRVVEVRNDRIVISQNGRKIAVEPEFFQIESWMSDGDRWNTGYKV